ncbi:MAG: ribonuclease Z [Bacteroidales bacterium]|nr:ribonuclease Z [Bacteroidales bacterium]
MNFTLTILGSASALPFSDRNPSAQALSVHGRLFLIDCGEGTQQRIRQEHLSFVKIEAIFISHIHGDHVFGLFGILSTMSLYHRVAPLNIYGPGNLGPVLNFYRSYFGADLSYEVIFHDLGAGAASFLYSPKKGFVEESAAPGNGECLLRITAFPLNHKIECYGFRFDEIVGPRSNPWKPRSYAYVSDTAPFEGLAGYVKGVDLLYHEATYPAEMEDKAAQYFHSTTTQAAACAKEAGVGRLIIGHYSSRVKDIASLGGECREIFPESYTVNDGDVFEIPYIREYEESSPDSCCDADGADSLV